MPPNIVKLSKPKNFPEDSKISFFKRPPESGDGGVSTKDLSNKERDLPFKAIIQKLHKDYQLEIYSEKRENSAFEILAATYITPHNDDNFLDASSWREQGLKEFQMLVPLNIPEDGYDVYVMDKQTKKIDKLKTEIGVPFVFDYDQIHWTLPSKLTKEEKELFEKVATKLKEFPSADFERSSKYAKLLNQITAMVRDTKNKSEAIIRWDEPSSVQFLSSRVFADPDLKKLLIMDKMKVQAKTKTKKKFKP